MLHFCHCRQRLVLNINAMRPEVISLCDSSDDEGPTAAKAPHQNDTFKQAPRSTVTSDSGGGGGVIDLLDDNSDEDEASSRICSGGLSSSLATGPVVTPKEESRTGRL